MKDCGVSYVWVPFPSLFHFSYGLMHLCSYIGMFGSIWVMYEYYRGRILNNLPGLFMFVIAMTDLGSASNFIDLINLLVYYCLLSLEQFVNNLNQWDVYINVIFDYMALTSCLLTLPIVFNTLNIIKFNGSIRWLQKYKYWVIAFILILPTFTYFLPWSIIFKEKIFFKYNRPQLPKTCDTIYCVMVFRQVVGTVITCMTINLICYLIIFIAIKKNEKVDDIDTEDREKKTALGVMKKLVMIYSIATVLDWTPWIAKYVMTQYFNGVSEYEVLRGCINASPIELLIFFSRSLLTPMRGYIHALAIVYVYSTVSGQKYTWLLVGSLQDPNAVPARPHNGNTGDSGDVVVKWDFTFDGQEDEVLKSKVDFESSTLNNSTTR
ncbi:hypothetical protein HDV02_003275 [Globomyces sp. JEL0801]|nr:hypothetical protein HDV02_003275 [Globomyces sp. JEL0801]